MNITRYSTEEVVPPQYTKWYHITTSGNEFSDMKSATMAINELIAEGVLVDTIRIAIYTTSTVNSLCYYTYAATS
jgi:hypothetical protein